MNRTLKTVRLAAGFTQGALAAAIGVDRTAYNRIERGNRRPPVDVALRIAAQLGTPVEGIFGDDCRVSAARDELAATVDSAG